MFWEDALVPAVQAVVISWTGIITAGAGYMFIQNQKLHRRIDELHTKVREFDNLAPLVLGLGLEDLKNTNGQTGIPGDME